MITGAAIKRAYLVTLLFALTVNVWAKKHEPAAAQPATDYPALDSHPRSQVAIAADPYDTPKKTEIFHIDYLKYGFMPIRMIVTNNSDQPISLADARIYFYTGYGDQVHAAEPDDVGRRVDKIGNMNSPGIPLPAPLPPIRPHPKVKDKQIQQDFDTFGFQSLTVAPHATSAGFLFYNIQGLADPLKGARLEVRQVQDGTGRNLFTFEIPFDKYLAAQQH